MYIPLFRSAVSRAIDTAKNRNLGLRQRASVSKRLTVSLCAVHAACRRFETADSATQVVKEFVASKMAVRTAVGRVLSMLEMVVGGG